MTTFMTNLPLDQLIQLVLVIAVALTLAFYPLLQTSFARFQRAALMNKSEARLYHQMRRALPADWTVMAQVSYGAFLSNRSFKRYRSVMSKRADFVIVDPSLGVAAVLEYHGGGHYGQGRKKRARVRASDAIKRKATTQAGIPLIELPANVTAAEITEHMRAILADAATPTPAPPQSSHSLAREVSDVPSS